MIGFFDKMETFPEKIVLTSDMFPNAYAEIPYSSIIHLEWSAMNGSSLKTPHAEYRISNTIANKICKVIKCQWQLLADARVVMVDFDHTNIWKYSTINEGTEADG